MTRALRNWADGQVRSTMAAAMRADPAALVRLASGAADTPTSSFLRDARNLTLAASAALTTVLTVHRYGPDPYERLVCLACGTGRCRTVQGVAEALAAYDPRAAPVDRAEAWRRADAWYARDTGRPVPLHVDTFEDGYVARPVVPPSTTEVIVIDRRTGALTQWPAHDTETLAAHYRDYRQGRL
ncbi:hypothetical protein AB0L25_23240 [Spirillospora sp. NPDC052242]